MCVLVQRHAAHFAGNHIAAKTACASKCGRTSSVRLIPVSTCSLLWVWLNCSESFKGNALVNIHRRPLRAEGRLKGALKLRAAVSRLLHCREPLHKSGLQLLLLIWFARLQQGKDMIFRCYSTDKL